MAGGGSGPARAAARPYPQTGTGWGTTRTPRPARPAAPELARRPFPPGRWGPPDAPARLIAWLVTDEAAWITGQVLSIDGGK